MAAKSDKPMSKSDMLNKLAETTGLSRKQVTSVVDELTKIISDSIGKKGPGSFNMPGLFKIVVTRKPATKATTRPNPFKPGEMMNVPAKPARNVVKIRPLKALKDMA